MPKSLTLAVVAIMGLSGAAFTVLPANAAPAFCNLPSSNTLDPIDDDPSALAAALAAKGTKVSGLEDFGGCIRGYVTNADGTQSMAYFDPDTLKRVDTASVHG
jgi:hypothetical protein